MGIDIDYDKWWNEVGRYNSEVSRWVDAFKERENVIRGAFGPTSPPNYVTAFSWNDQRIKIPGACALTFPPQTPLRLHWLTLTHGLTQPSTCAGSLVSPFALRLPGYGCEFGICTEDQNSWCTDLLKQILTYTQLGGSRILRGSRLPVFFARDESHAVYPRIKLLMPTDPEPVNSIRSLIFWPYWTHDEPFSTSTGRFEILVGTAITGDEWELAKRTSSAHLMLLLLKTGIGQVRPD